MRYQQPQNGPAKLTQQTAIARGLTFAYAGSGKRQEYAFGDVASNLGSGATIVDTANGQALRFSGGQATGAATWGKTYSRLLGATSFTVAFLATFSSVASGKVFAKWGGASGNIFLMQFNGSGAMGVIVGDTAGNRNTATTTSVITANTLVSCVWTWDVTRPQGSGNGHTIRINGVNRSLAQFADSNPSSVTSVVANTSSDWQLGVANDGTPMTGDIIAFNVWRNTVLNDDEQIAWAANPWQVYDDDVPDFPWPAGAPTSPALTGVVGTWAPGSVGVQVDATRALTGVVGTWAAGNVTAQAASTLALSGVAGTWAPGTLTPVVDSIRALTGVQGTWSAGTVTPSAASGLTLTSVMGTWAVGSVAVQVDATRALAGVAGTWGVGTVSPSSASSLALAGNQGTWAVGSVAATAAATAALTGVQGNWQAGSLEVGGDKQAALTGVVGTWGVGTVTVEPPRPVNFGGWIDYPKKKPTKKETQPKEKAVEKDNLRELIVQAIAAKAAPVAPRAVLAALPARVPKVQQRLKAEVDAVIETLVDDDDEEDLLLLIL